MAAVAIQCEAPGGRRYAHRIISDARALLKLLLLDKSELSLVLTCDSAMRELNRAYRGKDRPTDVLSFPQFEDPAGIGEHVARAAAATPAVLGDVVISIDTSLRQAARFGVSPASRLRTLLIHGMLHLVGYDHERSPIEARRMFARERELAAALESAAKCFGRRSASLLQTTQYP
jgi:rRNA maturation RNase YbeY